MILILNQNSTNLSFESLLTLGIIKDQDKNLNIVNLKLENLMETIISQNKKEIKKKS